MLTAATRATRWSTARRLFYVAASILIPFVLLNRVVPGAIVTARGRDLPRATLALLVLGMFLRAAGEFVGYAFGPGAKRKSGRRIRSAQAGLQCLIPDSRAPMIGRSVGVVGAASLRTGRIFASSARRCAAGGAADRMPAHARERRGRPVSRLQSAEDLLARPDVDAVVISVPTKAHADVAVAAIAAGKHVYIENPSRHRPRTPGAC